MMTMVHMKMKMMEGCLLWLLLRGPPQYTLNHKLKIPEWFESYTLPEASSQKAMLTCSGEVNESITSKNVSPLTFTYPGWVLCSSLPLCLFRNNVFLHIPNTMTFVGILIKMEKNELCHYYAPQQHKKRTKQ